MRAGRLAASGAGLFLALSSLDALTGVAWGVLAATALAAFVRGELDLDTPPSQLEWAVLAFLAVAVASAWCGLAPARSAALSVPTVAATLLWLVLTRTRATERPRAIVVGLVFAALIPLALVALRAVQAPQGDAAAWVRSAGASWLVVPNDAAWIACCVPLFALLGGRRAGLALALAASVAAAAGLLLHSRTLVALTMVVVAVYVAWPRVARLPRRTRTAVAVGAFGVAVAALLVSTALLPSMQARWQLWQAAAGVFAAHPWLGVGPHNFVLAYAAHYPPGTVPVDARLTPWPHNLLLELAAELGLGGIAAAIVVLAMVWNACANRAPFYDYGLRVRVGAGLAGLVLLSLTEASLLRQWLWYLATVLVALAVGGISSPDGQRTNEEQLQQ